MEPGRYGVKAHLSDAISAVLLALGAAGRCLLRCSSLDVRRGTAMASPSRGPSGRFLPRLRAAPARAAFSLSGDVVVAGAGARDKHLLCTLISRTALSCISARQRSRAGLNLHAPIMSG